MKYQFIAVVALVLSLAGVTTYLATASNESFEQPLPVKEESVLVEDPIEEKEIQAVVFPVSDYSARRTYKGFAEYVDDGRFLGYHVGEDIEFVDAKDREVPVVSIADGTIVFSGFVSGYGGLIKVLHEVNGEQMTALYGHIDLGSSPVRTGDRVLAGQFLANLGDHESEETDGRRKHLHFGLYLGNDDRLQGYELSEDQVGGWLNPSDVFADAGMVVASSGRTFQAHAEVGGESFPLSFSLPDGYDVEYIPQIDALNIYAIEGSGAARERSAFLIRFFDAERFLTLQTVEIFGVQDVTVGKGFYEGKKYDIEKKEGVEDFPHQPDWRNDRHFVTDFHDGEGYTRYFVVAANPEIDLEMYEGFLASMFIQQ